MRRYNTGVTGEQEGNKKCEHPRTPWTPDNNLEYPCSVAYTSNIGVSTGGVHIGLP